MKSRSGSNYVIEYHACLHGNKITWKQNFN